MAKKLPLGLQDFRKIIENNFLYVDKTETLFHIASSPGAYFLARPRRFGKSLTISTLHELFSGSRSLFQGLWIEDKWDWGKKHPVLRISFTAIGFQSLGLRTALEQELDLIAKQNGISLEMQGLAGRFRELIRAMAAQGSRTVVLVDEYDAPIIHFLGKDLKKAIENREMLREFYAVLKDCDTQLELGRSLPMKSARRTLFTSWKFAFFCIILTVFDELLLFLFDASDV